MSSSETSDWEGSQVLRRARTALSRVDLSQAANFLISARPSSAPSLLPAIEAVAECAEMEGEEAELGSVNPRF